MQSPAICTDCDAECGDAGCTGAGPEQCLACRNVLDGITCQNACPVTTYESVQHVCEACNKECLAESGCTGPSSRDCVECQNVYHPDLGCLAECPIDTVPVDGTCEPCHSQVRASPSQPSILTRVKCSKVDQGCGSTSPRDCVACQGLMFDGACVESCPFGHYPNINTMQCEVCDREVKLMACRLGTNLSLSAMAALGQAPTVVTSVELCFSMAHVEAAVPP